MELVHVGQVPFEFLSEEDIDVIMLACSKTVNSHSLLPSLLLPARRKIIFVFCDEPINMENLPENAEVFYFKTNADINDIHVTLESLCQQYHSDNIKLMIDYTHMHKSVLGAIVSFLSLNEFTCNRLTVYFYYADSQDPDIKRSVSEPVLQPIILYENYKFNQRPIALIIELNNPSLLEHVNELYHSFCPALVYFFVPAHLQKLWSASKLEYFQSAKTVTYHPQELELLDESLRQLCRQLRLEYRVIIVSMGSKIFSMVSFLINARYPDIEIWQYGTSAFAEPSADVQGEKYVYRAILSDDFIEKIN